jgi:hypothetical protein
MDPERKREIHQLLEASRASDTRDRDAEKTAAIGELLAELEWYEADFECRLLSVLDLGYPREERGRSDD